MRVRLMCFMMVLFFSANGQVRVRALVDSTTMLIGDQVHLQLEVTPSAGVRVADPYWPPNNDTLEFLALSKWDTLSTGTLIYKAVFTLWDTGYQEVPPIGVPYSGNGISDTAWTERLIMEVLPPTDSLNLNDIKDIVREPALISDYLPYLLGVGVVILIALAIWFYRRPTKPKKEVPPPPPPKPHEVALEKLAQLKAQKLWQQGEVKGYHSELTYIVREYLEGRFGIKALEETTDEIQDQLRKRNLPAELQQQLERILETADLVKFAKAQPTAEFHEHAFQSVQAFVERTRPVEAPPTEQSSS